MNGILKFLAAILAAVVLLVLPAAAEAQEWTQVAIKDDTNSVVYSESFSNAQNLNCPINRTFGNHALQVTRTVTGQDVIYCFNFTPAGSYLQSYCFNMADEVRCARVMDDDDFVLALAGSNTSGGTAPSIGSGALGTGTPGSTLSAGDEGGTKGRCCATYNGTTKCSAELECSDGHICDSANCEPPCISCK